MADIFVSYARADKARVAPLVAALEAQGWSMWWDREITPGQEFDEQITREIEAARAVIVVWTPASVSSRWVRGEARLAADRGTLVPVRFEAANLPLDVRAIHTTDLDDWKENAQCIAFQELLRALGSLLKTSPRTGGALPAHAPSTLIERAGLSVCVLPFANMSNDAEQEYFSDGISEDIITDLSKVSALAVVARNTAFMFKAKSVDIKHVARQLTVSHVLEGSVRESGNRVRITAQLIDGSTGNHIWAERYDRDLSDIFALQDEISQAIVAALKLKLFPEEKKAIEDRGTSNIEAYDKYLRARALYHHQGPEELLRAANIYREALALDPNFVFAWRGLYSTLMDSMIYAARDPDQALKEMNETSTRILALAPDAWWSHALRSDQFRQQHRWAEAEAAGAAALATAPASEIDAIQTFALAISAVGRGTESIKYIEHMRQIDPLSLWVSSAAQAHLDMAGRRAEAQAEYERSRDLSGDREIVEFWTLFRVFARGDDKAAIHAQVQRLVAAETVTIPVLHDLPSVFDQPETMLVRLRRAHTDPACQDSTRQLKIAVWAGHFGDNELAVAAMRRFAIELKGARLAAMWIPTLTGARRTEGFKQIVRDLGLYDYWRTTGKWGDFAHPVGDDDFECR
jgi:adenylate cyclase